MKRIRGFTLVELLVVIGIIAVLISILLPALNKAKQAADATACASNMHQIGAGFAMYYGDFKQFVPYGYWTNQTVSPNEVVSWDDLISKYIGNELTEYEFFSSQCQDPSGTPHKPGVLVCPADGIPASLSTVSRRSYCMVRNGATALSPVSLSANDPIKVWGFALGITSAQGSYPKQLRISQVPHPAMSLLLVERALDTNWMGAASSSILDNPPQQYYGSTANILHTSNTKFNYLFFDGHVDLLRPDETVGTSTVTSATPSGYWNRFKY